MLENFRARVSVQEEITWLKPGVRIEREEADTSIKCRLLAFYRGSAKAQWKMRVLTI
jgi:hypothetical protein